MPTKTKEPQNREKLATILWDFRRNCKSNVSASKWVKQISDLFPDIEQAKREERERIKERVEERSHCQATNMLGISLTAGEWQEALKKDN